MPTEEVFTMPHRDRVDGIVKSSKPLSYGGVMIDDFTVRFSAGRVVEVDAAQGEAVLRTMVASDEGAARLGEVALVPHSSPISQAGRLFYNTLFDENAASHVALGAAYRFTMTGGESMTDEAFAAAGGNRSMIHVDFMIGNGRLDVDGVRADGTSEAMMRNGDWVEPAQKRGLKAQGAPEAQPRFRARCFRALQPQTPFRIHQPRPLHPATVSCSRNGHFCALRAGRPLMRCSDTVPASRQTVCFELAGGVAQWPVRIAEQLAGAAARSRLPLRDDGLGLRGVVMSRRRRSGSSRLDGSVRRTALGSRSHRNLRGRTALPDSSRSDRHHDPQAPSELDDCSISHPPSTQSVHSRTNTAGAPARRCGRRRRSRHSLMRWSNDRRSVGHAG
jgi:hypothetical protein